MSIGENIKKYRIRKGLTQSELAARCGISKNSIGNYETNKRDTTTPMLEKIASALDLSTWELMVDEDEKKDTVSIGEKIKTLRKSRGLTQAELATLCGLSRNSIYYYENNSISTLPNTANIEKIASALGVSTWELMANKDTREDGAWFAIQQKLTHVGYKMSWDEDNASVWIDYPDGTLEVTENEIEELNKTADIFLKVQLQMLKEKNISRFRSYRKK